MKGFLIISSLLISSYAFAACPIDIDENSACSIAQFQEPMNMTYTQSGNIKEYSETPEARLKPNRNVAGEKMLREFGPRESNFSYNADCQFGVCYDKGGTALFLQDKGQ